MSRALAIVSYAVLGSILCWSRLVKLGQPLCCDEILTVEGYVRRGPETILTGAYVPNNHELFSLAGWATSSLVGESEAALRLWSVLPFVAAVALVAAWLHIRLGALSGVVYVFLATASPLLLDTSRQARGYGLAFLAMSVVVVAAVEAARTPRTAWIAMYCVFGVVGTWTLPHFVIAFFTIGAVLLSRPALRVRCAFGLGLTTVAIAAWYLPHAGAILETPRQDYGAAIETKWVISAPLDQTLVPAFAQGDDAFVRPNLFSLILAAAFAVVIASSPLLRTRTSALVLCSGVVTTVVAAWVTGAELVPRFFSFLLVPLLVLVATGAAASIVAATRHKARFTVAVAILLFASVVFTSSVSTVARFPRESLAAVATFIQREAPNSTRVYAYVPYPADLVFHLGRRVEQPRTPGAAATACRQRRPVFFVEQRWLMASVDLPCLIRPGVQHRTFRQYARGGRIELWWIPPARSRRHS